MFFYLMDREEAVMINGDKRVSVFVTSSEAMLAETGGGFCDLTENRIIMHDAVWTSPYREAILMHEYGHWINGMSEQKADMEAVKTGYGKDVYCFLKDYMTNNQEILEKEFLRQYTEAAKVHIEELGPKGKSFVINAGSIVAKVFVAVVWTNMYVRRLLPLKYQIAKQSLFG